ncbi:DUF2637 domain-containing protein [Streptomyces sp. MNP-20]|uniref:DUF2637 domain-containing protein n=1 Tax=Streptomyces sp. MNP-20 TaxID=2721165 RepID=UPI0020A6D177|nr:DUF2637 domain-containing protein [Streptomyces sp. MNP-20]
MKVAAMTAKQVHAAERTLAAGTWSITLGAVLFSVFTVTPLVRGVTPAGWEWTAPILPLVVDAAVVIVVRLDATVARLGGRCGRWPTVLRWLTGIMTLALNIGDSALHGDLVGVAVHAVAPTLLIVTAEAGLAYRRAITTALERIDREQHEHAEREREKRAERERLAREEREQQRAAAERREREAREHTALLELQRAEREAAERREQRAHEDQVRREEAERAERQRAEQRAYERAREEREQAERERREQHAQEQRERREREARERTAAAARERAARTKPGVQARPVNTAPAPAVNAKMNEADALAAVRAGHDAHDSVRTLADRTGWSVGWISARLQELRDEQAAA